MDADVVFQIHPGPEGGVQFIESTHPGDLGLTLELVLDDLVERLDFPLAIALIGRVAHSFDL